MNATVITSSDRHQICSQAGLSHLYSYKHPIKFWIENTKQTYIIYQRLYKQWWLITSSYYWFQYVGTFTVFGKDHGTRADYVKNRLNNMWVSETVLSQPSSSLCPLRRKLNPIAVYWYVECRAEENRNYLNN